MLDVGEYAVLRLIAVRVEIHTDPTHGRITVNEGLEVVYLFRFRFSSSYYVSCVLLPE